MLEIIKNMFRRKGRTILTISGITIGIFAFVVMGSMAERINLLVDGGTKYYADKITVTEKSSSLISLPVPLDIDKASELAEVEGVIAVDPTVYTTLDEDFSGVSFGPPASIVGTAFIGAEYESFELTYSRGRELNADDRGKITIGSDLVKKLDANVGSKIMIREKEYEVVGIADKTLTSPDTSVMMTLADAQEILYQSLPDIIKGQTDPKTIVNGFTVYIEDGVDPDHLATVINERVEGVSATGPKAFQDQIASATSIFNAILFGIALISLLVGGLSVINTMTMAISERIREIGVKKAVGARTRNIMAEYLTEAGLIGLLGGLLGLGLGALTVYILNAILEDSGNAIFLLTARISIFAVAFSVLLGVIAGIYPAYYAVKISIVKALREG